MSITIEIPEQIENHLKAEWGDVPRRALKAVAVDGYRSGALSAGQVAELLGLSAWETESFLNARKALLSYNVDDLERDMMAAGQSLTR